MKKVRLSFIYLLVTPFLFGCNKQPQPVKYVTHNFSFNGRDCTINGAHIFTHDIYEGDKNIQYTIIPDATYALPESIEDDDVEYDKDTGVITIAEIKNDITLNVTAVPKSPPKAKYTVTFDPNGGEFEKPSDASKEVIEGATISTPPVVSKKGYLSQNVKWFYFDNPSKEFIFGEIGVGTEVNENITLKADWGSIITNKVHFVETSTKTIDQDVNFGDRAVFYTPSREDGIEFLGWYKEDPETHPDATEFVFSDPIESETYIYAKWDGIICNVKFNITNCVVSYKGEVVTEGGVNLTISKYFDPYCAKFSVKANDTTYLKPSDVIIKHDDEQYFEYTYNKDNGDLYIDVQSDLVVTGVCSIYKSLEECSWAQIKTISTSGKAKDAFKVGDTKQVKLLNKESGEQELPHTVRIIGFGHDKDTSSKTIGITFEFVNLISDDNGYSLATLWQDADADSQSGSNHDYRDSTIRKNLTGNGGGTAGWYEKDEGTKSKTYNEKTVLDLLPSSLTSVLQTVRKKVNVYTGSQWELKDVDDKLFLPASKELGFSDGYVEEIGTYDFYSSHTGATDPIRIKQQVKGSESALTSATPITESKTGSGSSYAGYNGSDETGGYCWVRSPTTYDTAAARYIEPDGDLYNDFNVYDSALGIAPAFGV